MSAESCVGIQTVLEINFLLEDMHMYVINNKIKEFRMEQNINQKDLALRVGVDRKTIMRLENGETAEPSLFLAWKVSETLGKDITVVFQIEEK